MSLTQSLLKWYDHHGRKLPWRDHPTPYSTLVSEIMLQQTRVEAVLPLYKKFIERFPTIQDLARASQDEVLTYWQGLGYYSRARRLHQTAQIIVAEYNGCVPMDKDALHSLPGIGNYTLGAVLSMAFSQPVMAIDGNLLRVGSRLFLVQEPINRAKAKSRIQANFQEILPLKRPGDFNQALMDLGSQICQPKNPRCAECPISSYCQAFQEGLVAELPIKDSPKPPVQVQVTVYFVISQASVLLRKREFGGFLQGMWELPWWETPQESASSGLKVAEGNWLSAYFQHQAPTKISKMEYVFSHRHWLMTIFHHEEAETFYTPSEDGTHYLWQPIEKIDEIALPTVFKRVLTKHL